MSPENFELPLSPIDEAARKLHQTISSPFEGTQINNGYQNSLDIPVSPRSDFFTQPTYDDYTRLTTGYSANPQKNWKVYLGYDSDARAIGVSAVAVPLKHSDRGVSLLYRSTERHGFLRFLIKGDPENFNVLPSRFDQVEPISPGYIGQLLLSAGCDVRNFSTNPDKLRLELASLIDGSDNATITEKVRTRSANGIDAVFTRSTRCTPRGSSRRSRNHGTDFASAVETTLEFAHQNPQLREQIVVAYDYADYLIGLPTLRKRVLAPKNTILGQPDSNDYEVIEETKLRVNIDSMSQLADGISEVLPRK